MPWQKALFQKDKRSEPAPDSEYALEEQTELMNAHLATHGLTHLDNGMYATASYNQSFEPCDTHDEKITVKQCVCCDARKDK